MTSPPATGHTRSLTALVDRGIYWLARHWLAIINLFWGLYLFLPLLAPALMNAGWTVPARAIYFVYRPLCHQLPERSYFLDGDQIAYSAEELADAGVQVGLPSRDIGNEQVGWKVAFCQRDVAIYGSLFLAGLVYAGLRHRWRRWKMRFRTYLLFLVPMAVDGMLQLFGVYESTWVLRTVTGVIFGVGSGLFVYPYLEEAFGDVRRDLGARLHLE
jgi:uncharacterized membrane protein